ncbi:MAG: MarR family transcriptional regulator [Alphaproteobacteria bacterium]|nr:MarR family transcriptional regulator [Alphaproteobacteria bacterium]
MQAFDERKSFGLLIMDIGRLLRKLFDARIREQVGISSAQWAVLLQLAREDGPTQSALAEQIEIEQSSLVRHIDNLEQMQLIERRADAADRRTNRIHLTEKGEAFILKVKEVVTPLREELFGHLGAEQEATTLKTLNDIKSRAEKLFSEKDGK